MIAITPFLFLICLPFATDQCDWDLELTPNGEQVNEYHWVQSYPHGLEVGIDYNAKTIQMEQYPFDPINLTRVPTLNDSIADIMECDMEHCTYCGKMSFHGFSLWMPVDYGTGTSLYNMTESERRYELGMPEKPQRPSIDYPIWYQEKYAKDRNIFYD